MESVDLILDVRNLARSFGPPRRLLTASALGCPPVERSWGCCGPNGAGKTTAIRMIMGILVPDAGEISFDFDGHPPQALDKSKIGYLPEERGVFTRMSKSATIWSIWPA